MPRLSEIAFVCAVLVISEGAHLRTRKVVASFKASANANLAEYSFDQFGRDFGRNYKAGSAEYENRAAVFHASLLEVRAVRARNVKEGRSWAAGVHPFMDWSQDERQALFGYKPNRASHRTSGSFLQEGKAGFGSKLNSTIHSGHVGGMGISEGPILRQQGSCGSCWAISAAEAVEAQLQRNGVDRSIRVSAQALVDCVPNPQHCGGTGGCDGATGELAYSFMRDHGIPLENEVPYEAHANACLMQTMTGSWAPFIQKRVFVSGWKALESNRAEPLMQALVNDGPVVVSVDANPWFDYDSGVFDGCAQDAILGHAVLSKGYGEDKDRKYWLIQNSWGSDWGEHGHIRILRHDAEGSWCGQDRKPQEGSGCDGGPPEVTVCGMCGILYEPIIPEGVRIQEGEAGSSAVSANAVAYKSPPIFKPPPMPELSTVPKTDTVTADPFADFLVKAPMKPAEDVTHLSTPIKQDAVANDVMAALSTPFKPSENKIDKTSTSKAALSEVEKMKRILSEAQLAHSEIKHA